MSHVVITDPELLGAQLARVADSAEEPSRVVLLEDLPADPGGSGEKQLVVTGQLHEGSDVARALQAAACGARLVVAVDPGLLGAFVEELRGLGEVELLPDPAERHAGPALDVARPPRTDVLTPDQKALLAMMAQGWNVAEAAQRLYLSQRTAERRLAAARKALGVATTAEAVLLMTRPGAT